ncbi:LysR family transcriptional regulator [Enhygromyxa salina]|uniref:HTH-type transcriptional regulator DmlR n=1 Tax=Enhygromyxa salina TaxID=215803 RepID=A0A2S9YYQ5_9BACT|nr:LysR family transcriptional regulator [Enhygromyxa salina]PRQ10202.1 HTH-type transcriptional regulator DmlR [Enhygromyxa salina]
MTKSPQSEMRRGSRPVATWGTTDRLDLLQTYVQIIEAGSLSAAAAQLGTTQPTVSRRLQQLERALGRQLLNRSTHKMKPSNDGERCYRRAKELLASWEAFDAELKGDDAEPEGLLRVVVPHAFGQHMLVDVVAEFMRRHPRVTIEWELRDTAPDFITEGVDCAILVGEVRDPLTVAIRLAEIPRIVVGAPSVLNGAKRPSNAQELARLPWLAFKTFYKNDVTLSHHATAEVCRLTVRPKFGTDNLYALRSAALHGLGVCVMSTWIVRDELAKGSLIRLAPDWEAPPLPLYLTYPYTKFQPPRVRRFVDATRELMTAALGDTVIESPARKPRSPG